MSENKPKKNRTILLLAAAAGVIGIFALSSFKKDDKKDDNNTNDPVKPPTPQDTTVKYPIAKVGITKTNTIATDKNGATSNITEKTTLVVYGLKPVSKLYETDKGLIAIKDITITGSYFDNNNNQS